MVVSKFWLHYGFLFGNQDRRKPEVDDNNVMSTSKGVYDVWSGKHRLSFLFSFAFEFVKNWCPMFNFFFFLSFSLQRTNKWFFCFSGWKWRQNPPDDEKMALVKKWLSSEESTLRWSRARLSVADDDVWDTCHVNPTKDAWQAAQQFPENSKVRQNK